MLLNHKNISESDNDSDIGISAQPTIFHQVKKNSKPHCAIILTTGCAMYLKMAISKLMMQMQYTYFCNTTSFAGSDPTIFRKRGTVNGRGKNQTPGFGFGA